MSKSILTKYEKNSVFSGVPCTTKHHLVFGRYGAWRDLSEKFGLWVPITDDEHNMSSKGNKNQIHDNPAAEKLSKMLGQVAFEKDYLAKKLANANRDGLDDKSVDEWYDEAREAFRKEFGESFL